ncbi:hypothetical protein TTHERM_01205380 (macronuclear) [Tetrahymena thermophila SB210]|uniref:Uncharacterized protein n=1 Tax=Tetrahymena thermophila (strain SB210) TaxID=312017 RepID=Q22AH2_TETTS|nr:hypothetical protein TTHERM_01205380 [Tetrahymena thermophila SB210]EAR82302.2 hypothetical protein TTHERM_01205380 [Tetrahymena thermophila SB210]|eukprot:XP_001029965.2 hypothetical protein TTHERM_01205380 [Tetrahymena thermophila SB210]
MNININNLLNAQDEYFNKLEEHYQKEKCNKIQMKEFTIQMCIKIQRFIRQKIFKRKLRAVIKIQLWWLKYFQKKQNQKNIIHRARLLISKYKIFYFLQKIHKKKKVLKFTQIELNHLKALKFSKTELQKIIFLQQFFSMRYKVKKNYLKHLVKKIKTKIQASQFLKRQKELSLMTSNMYREQLMTNLAFENEIKFIDNTLSYNQLSFKQKWDQYEQKLTKFMKGRNKTDNFIEQRNAFGESVWTNIKTMEQTDVNPVDQYLQANIKKFKEQAENEFLLQNEYLEKARDQLVISKQNYQKASVDMFLKYLNSNK